MNNKNLKTLAALLAFSAVGFANAQETISYATDSLEAVDNWGDPENVIYTNSTPAIGGYNLGASVDVTSLTLTEIASATYASEFGVGLRNSGFPGIDARFAPSTVQGYTGTLVVTPANRPLTGSLVNSAIAAGSTWSIEVADTFNDGLADVSEQTGTNFVFATTAFAPPTPSDDDFIINGNTTDSIGDPDNVILSLGTHTGAPYVLNELEIKGGSVAIVDPASFASEAGVLLRNSAFPALGQVVRPATTTAAGPLTIRTISAQFATNGFAAQGYYLNLWGQTIPTGSTWTGELFESFNDSQDAPEGAFVNFALGLKGGAAAGYPTGTAPSTFTDLGVIDTSTAPESAPLTSAQTSFGTIETRWFKFTLNSPTNYTSFLDIFTTAGDGEEDTDMALFDSDGRIRAVNDDLYAAGGDYMSQMAIGGSLTPRPGTDPALGGNALAPFNGFDALGTLPAGTYYLAVSPWDTDYDHGFVADTAFADPGLYAWTLNLRTNLAPGAGAATIAGNLELLNTVGSGGTESIGWTLTNGVNSYTGNVSVADVGSSAYSIAIPGGAPNGAYTLKFKGGTFLSKTLNVTLTGSSLTGQNAALKNGDIDQDTEVGPGDFEAVVAQFGGPGDADVDNDGEVGPSDFETVVANFGIGDE
jgi:hypothetical protein